MTRYSATPDERRRSRRSRLDGVLECWRSPNGLITLARWLVIDARSELDRDAGSVAWVHDHVRRLFDDACTNRSDTFERRIEVGFGRVVRWPIW